MLFILRPVVCLIFFFFKQKTAYEMRISDWSSDVCSSDLRTDPRGGAKDVRRILARLARSHRIRTPTGRITLMCVKKVQAWDHAGKLFTTEIGRASCRERVCQYV